MRLDKETFRVPSQLHDSTKLFRILRRDSSAQNHRIGFYFKLSPEDMIVYRNEQPFGRAFDFRRSLLIKANEYHAELPCLGIVIFEKSVRSHVPEKDIYHSPGILLFNKQGVLHGILAAYTRTILIFLVSRSDTLDHYN